MAILFASVGLAQSCPPLSSTELDAKDPSTLHGIVSYHDGTRPWLGLVPDRPVCGTKEIELAFADSTAFRRARQMRNCEVTASGVIHDSATIYYATDLNFFNPKITPDKGCHLFPGDPDYAAIKIPEWVADYKATVFIDVKANKPLEGRVVGGGAVKRPLAPWRAYALISLNGEEDLDLACRDGFRMTSFSSVPSGAAGPAPLFTGWARVMSSELGPASLTIECRRK